MRTLILFLISTSLYGACAGSWTNGYTFCREITIDHTKVTADQTNFPVPICIGSGAGSACSSNAKELATEANGGRLVNVNGYDFIFTSDNAGTTPIAYERALQNLTTGDAELWVKVASLSSSVDTKIYLFYRNSGITTDQSNPTAVWDANYLAVWHFPLTSGFYANSDTASPDSTSNAFNEGAAFANSIQGTSGILGGGADFSMQSMVGEGFSLTPLQMDPVYTGLPTGSDPRMIEAWTNLSTIASSQSVFMIGINENFQRYNLQFDASITAWGVEGTNEFVSFPGATNTGAWHYIVAGLPSGQTTFIGSIAYVDGVAQTLTDRLSGTQTVNTAYTGVFDPGHNGTSMKMGDISPSAVKMLGLLDEVRLSNTVRSSTWISTTYNSINSPNTFYTLGPENGSLPVSGGGPRPVIFK